MSKDTEYIATLVDYTVSEDNERVDLEACLEIADRANASKPECVEVIRSITKCLGKSNPKVVLNTLQLLETLCKNCNMRFLYELNNKKLVDALLKVVQRRRDRAKYGTKASKSSNPIKIDAEDRILYLFQLWADTFMMHQTEFRNIHEAYRNLRKDGVQFPERDTNEKFMINFQGQVSPVFLAMEGNVVVPSNNQGGPVSDPNRKTTQSFKPKPVEYQHEYASSQVQNTLYDEDEADYDYSAYDGIQITEDEVRILEESMSILKEIEKNAVKPADMRGEIAKEILSDLVHVHKRLKRFIREEKFANGSQRNEAIKLNSVLGACLTSYKNKYYRLKEEQQRRTRTEPDDDGGRYDSQESPRNPKLVTEVGEGSYTERVRPSNDFADPKKKPIRKVGMLGNKLAPPTGWKNPLEVDKNLNGNPDLIDLLNTKENENKAKSKQSYEERKEEPLQAKKPTQDLLNDLLDLNFDAQKTAPVNPMTSVENKNFPTGQIPAQQFNNAQPNAFGFQNFGTPSMIPQGQMGDMNALQQQFGATNISGVPNPVQNFNNFATNQVNPTPVNNDDDDFFSDIANRKK